MGYAKSVEDGMMNNCPNIKSHTECPEGYRDWHSWAEKKAKTHNQVKCPGCGLYSIWVETCLARGACTNIKEEIN